MFPLHAYGASISRRSSSRCRNWTQYMGVAADRLVLVKLTNKFHMSSSANCALWIKRSGLFVKRWLSFYLLQ